jgi:hypothetical protein
LPGEATSVAEAAFHFARELAGRGQNRHDRPITRERRVFGPSAGKMEIENKPGTLWMTLMPLA